MANAEAPNWTNADGIHRWMSRRLWKRGDKNDAKNFGLNDWKEGVAIHWAEKEQDNLGWGWAKAHTWAVELVIIIQGGRLLPGSGPHHIRCTCQPHPGWAPRCYSGERKGSCGGDRWVGPGWRWGRQALPEELLPETSRPGRLQRTEPTRRPVQSVTRTDWALPPARSHARCRGNSSE